MIILIIITPFSGMGQQGYKYREYDRQDCLDTYREYIRKPDNVYFDIRRDGNDFYAWYNNKEWFDEFFSDQGRKLGVQLVSTGYFDCTESLLYNSTAFFHYMDPKSSREMEQSRYETQNGFFVSHLGTLPLSFQGKEFDHGLIISKRNRFCIDHWFAKIMVTDWDLIDLALLADTLVFSEKDIPEVQKDTSTISSQKVMRYEVIFDKNKTLFNKDSLLSFVYDLPLQDYNPQKVHIEAYASVEGPADINKDLFEKRARVIYDEILPFLPQDVGYQFEVSENWNAFFRDIMNTEFAAYRYLDRDSVKRLLHDVALKKKMEPMLAKHRKTIVEIRFDKSIKPYEVNAEELFDFYYQSIFAEDLENALKVQNAIFERMKSENFEKNFQSVDYFPEDTAFANFINREYVYRFASDFNNLKEIHHLFKQLHEYYPENDKIKFNLAEIMFRMWMLEPGAVDKSEMVIAMQKLKESTVPSTIVNRLLLNYYLVDLRKSIKEEDQRRHDRNIRSIRSLFSKVKLNDKERLSMARWLTAYQKRNMAERLLRPYVRKDFPDEDLLFYYVSLTISESHINRQRWYEDLLEIAYQINPERFCNLFLPVSDPRSVGISLLFQENLKELFCTYCGNHSSAHQNPGQQQFD